MDQLVDRATPAPPTAPTPQTLKSKRWQRFGGIFFVVGLCTAFWGTLPLGVALFQVDNVAKDNGTHWNTGQTTIAWVAIGLIAGGIGGTVYIAYKLRSRPCLRVSTFGVTVYNWRSTVDTPWAEVGGVKLVSVRRMRRDGWVSAITRPGRDPVPIRFGPFMRVDAGRSTAVAPPVPNEAGWAQIVEAVQGGRTPPSVAGPAGHGGPASWPPPPGAIAERSPLALPDDSVIGWGNGKVVVARDWVAYRASKGKVPWNVWSYGDLAEARLGYDGRMTVARADGSEVVIDKVARQSLETTEMLSHGLEQAASADLKAALAADIARARSIREKQLARYHRVDSTGTVHVFSFRGRLSTWLAWFFLLGAVCALGGAVAYPFYGKPPSFGFELLFIGLGVFALWFGICLFKLSVTISPDRMLIWNELSFRRVDPKHVHSLTLVRRSKGDAGVQWESQVDLEGGGRVRITSMGYGPGGAPPRPARLQILNEMRELLGVVGRQEGF